MTASAEFSSRVTLVTGSGGHYKKATARGVISRGNIPIYSMEVHVTFTPNRDPSTLCTVVRALDIETGEVTSSDAVYVYGLSETASYVEKVGMLGYARNLLITTMNQFITGVGGES